MPALSFDGMLVVALVAVAVPVLLGLAPRLPVPGAVLEVLAGILIGPSVLGWVHLDAPVEVLSDLGLGMLLFLAGLEIDVEDCAGRWDGWRARHSAARSWSAWPAATYSAWPTSGRWSATRPPWPRYRCSCSRCWWSAPSPPWPTCG